jgi:hypothetical protein
MEHIVYTLMWHRAIVLAPDMTKYYLEHSAQIKSALICITCG